MEEKRAKKDGVRLVRIKLRHFSPKTLNARIGSGVMTCALSLSPVGRDLSKIKWERERAERTCFELLTRRRCRHSHSRGM